MNGCRKIASVNLLNLNNSVHILHTAINTYVVLLIRRFVNQSRFLHLLLGLF